MEPVGVLDDYQAVAQSCADWDRLDRRVEFIHEAITDRAMLIERLSPFEVLVAMRERTPFPRDVLASLPNLRLLVTTGMRNTAIDVEAASELGITVCGTRSTGHATAELTFGLILALARGLVEENRSVRSGGWQVSLGRDLGGAVLGVVGVGRVGSLVAGYGAAFGMEVVAWSDNLTDERAAEAGTSRVSREEIFATADFVTVHLRLSDRTRGLVGRTELQLMRPTSYLINTSRGPIVDTDALLEAVRSGSIAGAAVDVYDTEPLPSDHPIRGAPRIITTPHVGYVTRETYEIFYSEAVEDIAAWTAGSPVRTLN